METITHFGLQIKSKKNCFKLDEDNYYEVSRVVSIAPFCNWFLHDENYRYFPKNFVINYLTSLVNYFKNDYKNLTSRQLRDLLIAVQVLQKVKYFKPNANKIFIRNKLKSLQKNYDSQSIDDVENRYLKMLSWFDFSASIEGKIYSQSWCDNKLKDVKQNFELNMKYFNSLSYDEFNSALNIGLNKIKKFREVKDLNNFWYKPGYYILVLDNYKQLYVGTTDNLTKRIKEHWIKKKPLDRLIFPPDAITTSLISIDAFKALDTTRIFIYQTRNTYSKEDEYISAFPLKFVINRLNGGRIPLAILHKDNIE